MKSFKIVISLLVLGCFSMPSFAGPLLVGQDTATESWKTVLFDSQLLNPVVFTSLPVNTNSSDQITQVRNVTNYGFDVRMLDPYGNTIAPKAFDYLAVEAGVHVWNNNVFEAGTTVITTEPDTLGASASVSLSPFNINSANGSEPGVITSTQTVNDPNDPFMVTRTRNISGAGFEVHLQTLTGQSGTTTPNQETVGWLTFKDISFEYPFVVNEGYDGGLRWQGEWRHREANNVPGEFNVNLITYDYLDTVSGDYLSEDELRLALFGQMEFKGSDLAWLSEFPADPDLFGKFSVFVDEDGFNDPETAHTNEGISLLAIGIPLSSTPEPAPVPEPASVWLLLLGVLGLSRRRSGDTNRLIAL